MWISSNVLRWDGTSAPKDTSGNRYQSISDYEFLPSFTCSCGGLKDNLIPAKSELIRSCPCQVSCPFTMPSYIPKDRLRYKVFVLHNKNSKRTGCKREAIIYVHCTVVSILCLVNVTELRQDSTFRSSHTHKKEKGIRGIWITQQKQ